MNDYIFTVRPPIGGEFNLQVTLTKDELVGAKALIEQVNSLSPELQEMNLSLSTFEMRQGIVDDILNRLIKEGVDTDFGTVFVKYGIEPSTDLELTELKYILERIFFCAFCRTWSYVEHKTDIGICGDCFGAHFE